MSKGHSTSAVPRPRRSAPRVRALVTSRAASASGQRDPQGERKDARRARRQSWSDIEPRTASAPARHRDDDAGAAIRSADHTRSDQTRFGTRVLDDDLQIATRRPQRWLIAGVALAVFAALVAALFVLPVQAWLRQEDEIAAKRQELEVLTEANRKLSAEVDHLATAEGAKEAARDELGVVGPGEERISVLPGLSGPLPLPAGWPYDTINQIVGVRAATVPVTTPAGATATTIAALAP